MTKFQENFVFSLFEIINKGNVETLSDITSKAYSILNLQNILFSRRPQLTFRNARAVMSKTESSDVNVLGLFDELKTLRNVIRENLSSLLDLLRFLQKSFAGGFLNLSIALRVVLTIPISSGEQRSFSRLKLIKTYLRANMK